MSVKRISKPALDRIVGNRVTEESTCVIKFYSNSCPMCHNLQEYFEDIAAEEQYSDVHFFAFNVDDYPHIEKQLGFNGVPTISLLKVGTPQRRIRILKDPEKPNKNTWYTTRHIKDFIDRER